MRQHNYFILSVLIFILISCKPKKEVVVNIEPIAPAPTAAPAAEEIPPYLKERNMSNFQYLKMCMSGSFSSELQSKQDSDFYNISLNMVPIWKDSENVFFLYVEQAMASKPNEPYRQRVYKVVKENENTFASYIYTLPNEKNFIGRKSGDPLFDSITQEDIIEKDGCEVHLSFNPVTQSFNGGTGESSCPSDRNNAKYTTSKVAIDENKMVSWDQGWDEKGKQVWGATKGGYIFIKKQ